MTKTMSETDWAEKIGKPAYESIAEMVKRLEHSRECSGDDDCYLTAQGMTQEELAEYHDEEAARDAIVEDPLSLEVRCGWHSPGETGDAEEFRLLLGTGGPAVRIIGELDNGEPRVTPGWKSRIGSSPGLNTTPPARAYCSNTAMSSTSTD